MARDLEALDEAVLYMIALGDSASDKRVLSTPPQHRLPILLCA